MNLLDDLKYSKIEKLKLKIGENIYGWLKLQWDCNDKNIDYKVSYICEPWVNLVGNFLKFCKKEKASFLEEYRLKYSAIYNNHDLEGDEIMFLFYKYQNEIIFLIMKDMYDDEIDDFIWSNFDTEEYLKRNFYDEEPREIKDRVIFAFKDTIQGYAKKFLEILDIIDTEKIRTQSEEDEWAYFYPKYYRERLYEISELI